MTTLGVDPSGLEAWSAQCVSIAGKLAALTAAPAGPGAQATAAAVSAGQTLIGGTTAAMSSRVQATGAGVCRIRCSSVHSGMSRQS